MSHGAAVGLLLAAGGLGLLSCSRPARPPRTPVYGYTVVRTYPHSRQAFTQGLCFDNGILYESTGLEGRSTLRKTGLASGQTLHYLTLPPEYFGEGLALVSNWLIQLTWKNQQARVYDRDTFRLLTNFTYAGEGWGLAFDGQRLIKSDGSDQLTFLNPDTFQILGQIRVTDGGKPVTQLNELETVGGEIWANVWHTDLIARIDPQTGHVRSWIDLRGLYPESERSHPEAVLNGMAYDPAHDEVLVTGKLWPQIFAIKLTPAN